jgi:hypothetical protein
MGKHCGRMLVVLLIGCALRAGPAAAEYCPSCMEQALIDHGNDTYNTIEKAWKDYLQVAAFMKQLEASGDEAQKAKFLPLWQKVQAEWRRVERMAREYASPAFKTHLDEWRADMTRRAQRQRERLHRQTDVFRQIEKAGLGPTRQGLINDMLGFRKEAEELKHEFYADAGLAAISSAEKLFEKGVEAAIKGVEATMKEAINAGAKPKEMLWSAALLGVLRSGEYGAPVVANTLETVIHAHEFQKAQEQNNRLRSFAAAVHGASDSALTFVNLLAKADMVTLGTVAKAGAQKGAMYLHIVALGLDNYMIDKSFERLAEAEQRMRSVESSEQYWKTQIEVSVEHLHRAERRLSYLNTEIAHQRRIADLYQQIQAQKP